MSKQYWNGVLNRLPNFFKDMGSLCMKSSMMEYQFRHGGCGCQSVFTQGGYQYMNPSGGYYPGGTYTGGDNQGMEDSLWGNFDENGILSYNDTAYQQGLYRLFPEPQLSLSRSTDVEASPAPSQAADEDDDE